MAAAPTTRRALIGASFALTALPSVGSAAPLADLSADWVRIHQCRNAVLDTWAAMTHPSDVIDLTEAYQRTWSKAEEQIDDAQKALLAYVPLSLAELAAKIVALGDYNLSESEALGALTGDAQRLVNAPTAKRGEIAWAARKRTLSA